MKSVANLLPHTSHMSKPQPKHDPNPWQLFIVRPGAAVEQTPLDHGYAYATQKAREARDKDKSPETRIWIAKAF